MSIPAGVTALIGANGAGKSTLLRILLDLTPPDTGSVTILGLPASGGGREIRRRIGVCHEKPRYPPHVTGRQALRFSAALKGVADPGAEAVRCSQRFGIAAVLDRRVRTYSAGMQQRLALADAMIGDPPLLLLDEPTANLDPEGRADVLRFIREQASADCSVIFSTHLLHEADVVADHVVLLADGRVLLAEPRSRLGSRARRLLVRVSDAEAFEQAWRAPAAALVRAGDRSFALDLRDLPLGEAVGEIHRVLVQTGATLEALSSEGESLETIVLDALRAGRSDAVAAR